MEKDTIISFKGLGVVRTSQVDHSFVEELPTMAKLHIVLKSCATYSVPFRTMEEAQAALAQITGGMQGRTIAVVKTLA